MELPWYHFCHFKCRYEYLETLDLRSSLSDWIGILHNHNNDISIRFFKILLPPSLLLVSLVNKGRRNLKHLALTENSQMKRFQAWQKGTRTSPFKNIPFSMNWISMKTLREWRWWLVGQTHFKTYYKNVPSFLYHFSKIMTKSSSPPSTP